MKSGRRYHRIVIEGAFFLYTLLVFKLMWSDDIMIKMLIFIGVLRALTNLKKLVKTPSEIITEGSRLYISYMFKKDMVLPSKQITGVVFKEHSIHTYYLEINYKDSDDSELRINLASKHYSNLRNLASELHRTTQNKEIFSTVYLKEIEQRPDDEKIGGLVFDENLNKEISLAHKIKESLRWRNVRKLFVVQLAITALLFKIFDSGRLYSVTSVHIFEFKVLGAVFTAYLSTYALLRPFAFSIKEINEMFGKYTGVVYTTFAVILKHFSII